MTKEEVEILRALFDELREIESRILNLLNASAEREREVLTEEERDSPL